MIAIPGMFCDAIATRYSGRAIVNTLAGLKVGWMYETLMAQSEAETLSPWFRPMRVKARTIATGEAQIGANQ
jgi:hypothetical protein